MKTIPWFIILGAVATAGAAGSAAAQSAADDTTVHRQLPVKEVTVFKDGHAFVVHEGALATETTGEVVIDHLPAPVIGTFWAFSKAGAPKVSGVIAGHRRAEVERTALTLAELIEGNPGAEVAITETGGTRYPATIIGLPMRTPQELDATSPPNAPMRLSEKSGLVMLKTPEGTKVVPLERIQDVVFRQSPNSKSRQEEFRSALTLKLDWGGRSPEKSAEVGLVYVQKGIRWIPSYKIDLGANGMASVRLQATVLNELTDLKDTTLQLVIGMPTFHFKDTVDPVALQQSAAQLSQFFQTDAAGGRASALANNFSNTIMTQVARAGEYGGAAVAVEGQPDGLPQGSQNEDLYVFSVPGVTLKKGERLVLPLADLSLPYEDVYTLHLPFAPPGDMQQQFNTQQQAELARLFHAPKVAHKAKIKNQSDIPFTTAPALVSREGRVLSQGLMTYATPGTGADVNITAALDIAVTKSDRETKRTPNALSFGGSNFMRIDLEGSIKLINHKSKSVEIEVVRHALGHVDSADTHATVTMNNVFEGMDMASPTGGDASPLWWRWASWPSWWSQVNGIGRIAWSVKLDPGKSVDLGYAWHYYWH
ncbi:MAG: hypothetical protein ACKV19_05590 [Verrucomicrobiales bacterium]